MFEQFKLDSICEQFPIDDYVHVLDLTPKDVPYNHITEGVSAIWNAIIGEYGEQSLEVYNRKTMLALIESFEARAAGRDYTTSVVDQFQLNFLRIKEQIQSADIGAYLHTSDTFLKDFGLCRQKLFPAGAQVVEEHSAYPRSIVIHGGIKQFFKFLYFFFFVARGFKPFYQIHTHVSTLEDFNPEGWDRCYVRLAEMMVRHPEVKGMFGGSWFYDPALEKISPRLVYLRERPESNGAWVFCTGDDQSGNALSKSSTRKKMYEEGYYRPKSYAVIWPRERIIAWRKRQKEC